MAIQLCDIQNLIDQINQFRHPKIKFYGCNGMLYIVTENTGIPVGPSIGTSKRDAYWFLKGMLAGVGADHLNTEEQKKAFGTYCKVLDAKDAFLDYICYENTVDDPEAYQEFISEYGCKPDAFLDHGSSQYLLDDIVASFNMEGGNNLPRGKQQVLWKAIIERKLVQIKAERGIEHGREAPQEN